MLPTLAIVQRGIVLFDPHPSIVRLADIVRHEFRPGEQIVIDGPYENFASANFYMGQHARVLRGHFGDLGFGSRYPKAKAMFVDETEFVRLWQGLGRVYLLSDVPDRLRELQALSPRTLVLGRSGKNWLYANRPAPGD